MANRWWVGRVWSLDDEPDTYHLQVARTNWAIDTLVLTLDWIEAHVFRHRFCHWITRPLLWMDKHTNMVLSVPITKEQAFQYATEEQRIIWTDEDNDDETE